MSSPNCPICSNTTSVLLFRYSPEQAAEHFCARSRNTDRYERLHSAISKLWGERHCDVRQCAACGFGFSDPFLAGSEDFYSILHESHWYPPWRWDYDFAQRHAISARESGCVLDIGAGTGSFLKAFSAGWVLCAVEGSEVTRQILRDKGISVYADMAVASSQLAGAVDVVTMFQVLEHLSNPLELLQQSRKTLKKGGHLVITVPDASAMLRQSKLTPMQDMPPNHIGKYTPEALTLALQKSGFTASPAVYAPVRLRQAITYFGYFVSGDSRKPLHPAAFVSRVKNRKLRHLLFAAVSPLSIPRAVPVIPRLMKPSAFGVVAEAI